MTLTERQEKLFDYVKIQHGNQKRKYTGEPYWTHLLSVAEIVEPYNYGGLLVEIALCHDLFEDTKCLGFHFMESAIKFGYSGDEARLIYSGIESLTDTFTKDNFPNLNRLERKSSEAARLGKISIDCQTVKYADLIDNTSSIVEHDKKFAIKYLAEKRDILAQMRHGDIDLLIKCCHTLYEAQNKLKLNENHLPI